MGQFISDSLENQLQNIEEDNLDMIRERMCFLENQLDKNPNLSDLEDEYEELFKMERELTDEDGNEIEDEEE